MRVGQQLRPELVGRISEKIVFNRLDFPTQRAICEQMISDELARLRAVGYEIEVSQQGVEFLIRQGYHKTLGARPMRGAVERYLQDAVASDTLLGGSGSGRIILSGENDKLMLVEA
jgi:ATP-dependent Clp protease ATP-binding subunit ClpB